MYMYMHIAGLLSLHKDQNRWKTIKRPLTSGRPKGGSVNMALGHAREVAPAKISEAKLSPTVSTNTTAVRKVCTCLLQSPVMLPCLHHICVDCLCLRIQQSGQIICADCQTIHPMVTASVQVAPPLFEPSS